jgi:hypothetical protein
MGGDAYDYGTPIVVAGVTTRQGDQESWSQGKGAAHESEPDSSLDKGRKGRVIE